MTVNKETVFLNADELFRSRYELECIWVHRFMTWILIAQWLLGLAFALFWSPYTWIGQHQEIHIHVWAAIIVGGALSGFGIFWMKSFPRKTSTRHVVAVTQMLWSALLIHLSGGRIETHFHIFASLAILSIYRDWKILISATAVVAIDHFVRGVFYPASVFGVFTESPYRWIEHAAWVVFEVSFLAPGCYRLRNEVRELCVQQSEIQEAKRSVDRQVEERTKELSVANERLKEKTVEAEKLALVAKYTDNAVVIMDSDSSIEWVNSGYSRITGYSPEDVVGKRPSDFQYGAETDRAAIEMMNDAFEQRKGFNVEVINYRKNREPFWLAMETRPIVNSDGETVRFIAIQSDVTERKQMELSLADAEARLRSIINNVPGAFYRKAIGGDSLVQTEFMSDFIEQLTGYSAQEFTEEDGLNHLDFVHRDDARALQDKLKKSLSEKCGFEHEYRIVGKDRMVRWVSEQGHCRIFDEDDPSQITIDGMLFDITDRVKAESENQKLHADLLEASRQAGMAEIATGVLHNVGNILNSVNVSAAVIRRQLSQSALAKLEKVSGLLYQHESSFDDFVRDDARGRKVPAYIQKVTDALCDEREKVNQEFDDLLKNVGHIKEIVSAQQSMAKSSSLIQELNPEDLLRDAISANKSSLDKHRIYIEQSFGEAVPNFMSDKHRILQILVNLIRNAKDALRDSGNEHSEIRLRVSADDQFMTFRVADNGVGIPKEKLEKIFQHGFTTKTKGHGFGLHSSANAATELGGVLTAASDGIGHGATFELRLPLEPAAETNEEAEADLVGSTS